MRSDVTMALRLSGPRGSRLLHGPPAGAVRSVVLAAIVRRQVIDRDAATKLPSAASGLLDGQHHPVDIRGRGGRGAPRTAAHRSTQAISANIAYPAGEVLQVGAYAVIVPQPRWCGGGTNNEINHRSPLPGGNARSVTVVSEPFQADSAAA